LRDAEKCVPHRFLPKFVACKYLFIYMRHKKYASLPETSDRVVGNDEAKVPNKIVTVRRFFKD
jgi:hypothetical protein